MNSRIVWCFFVSAIKVSTSIAHTSPLSIPDNMRENAHLLFVALLYFEHRARLLTEVERQRQGTEIWDGGLEDLAMKVAPDRVHDLRHAGMVTFLFLSDHRQQVAHVVTGRRPGEVAIPLEHRLLGKDVPTHLRDHLVDDCARDC